DGRTFTPDPSKATQYNRGAYLVEGPGHCAECHSGRNFLGGVRPSNRFAGGADLEGEGWVPNITPHPDGLAGWSVADFELFLSTGLTPDGASVSGNMGEVIRNISKLKPDDRPPIATYLLTGCPGPGAKPTKKSSNFARRRLPDTYGGTASGYGPSMVFAGSHLSLAFGRP